MFRGYSYLAILLLGIIIGLMRLNKQDERAVADDYGQSDEDWHCSQCAETVPQNFAKCWNCGHQREQ